MIDFHIIFDHLPECYLILQPTSDLIILHANKAYLKATDCSHEIIGKPLFEVFPDNPDDPEASGVKNLSESLAEVIFSRKSHVMKIQRYDTRIGGSGNFRIRYWKPCNLPVLDLNGNLKYIVHTVQDVTDLMLLRNDINEMDSANQLQIIDAVRSTQEIERLKISQELHDNINQLLNTARLYLEKAMKQEEMEKNIVSKGLELVKNAMSDVKDLSNSPTKEKSININLEETLQNLLSQVKEITNINVHATFELPEPLAGEVKLALTRILQEQLTNTIKHSEAKNLYVHLFQSGNSIVLDMEDDGKGFNLNSIKEGTGIKNIKSRVIFMDGQAEFISSPGGGTHLIVQIPGRAL